MKIVEIIHALNPGGAERLLVDLSNRFVQDEDTEVFVIALKNRDPRNENFYVGELSRKIHFIPMGFGDGVNLSYPLKIYKVLQKIKPDVVHIHCVFKYLILPIIMKRNCKYVITLHNKAEEGFPGFQKHVLYFLLRKKLINIVTISDTNQESLRNYLNQNNDVLIYNGRKQPEKTASYPDIEKFFLQIRTTSKTIILLAIAKCSVQKNLGLLISSINALNNEKELNLDFKLLILGDGYHDSELGLELLTFASDSIIFLGPKNNVADYFYLCDAFCLSSLFEGMPITLIEALACECITISTPVSGIIDIIHDGKTGFISPDFSEENYKKTLLCFIEKRREVNKSELKEMFLKYYSIDKCAEAYYRLFVS
ncbi:glycosyltransferase [Sphingobacterium olei]|uniref:Glycosyltransferase n=1 Tax=Sphingobacterium olei TaxID=2571155 RepID=A0A4U0NYJ2_9SPHI|nr:glycosyltransferase [Sphingobacterium olei]TJZ59885.1 glycosyltransferase [Sphingobacterium olei]